MINNKNFNMIIITFLNFFLQSLFAIEKNCQNELNTLIKLKGEIDGPQYNEVDLDVKNTIIKFELSLSGSKVGECSGTLVLPKVILTAAHCVKDGLYLQRFKIGSNLNPKPLASVSQKIIHPNYNNNNSDHDLAIIVLENSLLINSFPQIHPGYKLNDYRNVENYFLGFGDDRWEYRNGRYESFNEDKLDIGKVANSELNIDGNRISFQSKRTHSINNDLTEEVNYHNQSGLLTGDSGGPIISKLEKKEIIFGVNASINLKYKAQIEFMGVTYDVNNRPDRWGDLTLDNSDTSIRSTIMSALPSTYSDIDLSQVKRVQVVNKTNNLVNIYSKSNISFLKENVCIQNEAHKYQDRLCGNSNKINTGNNQTEDFNSQEINSISSCIIKNSFQTTSNVTIISGSTITNIVNEGNGKYSFSYDGKKYFTYSSNLKNNSCI